MFESVFVCTANLVGNSGKEGAESTTRAPRLPHCLEEQSQEEGTESKSHGRKFLLPSIKRETFFATAESFPKVSGISDRATHAPHTVQV